MDEETRAGDGGVTLDSLINLASNLGTGRDKQAYSQFEQPVLSAQELDEAYRSWLPSKVACFYPEDMVREGRRLNIENKDVSVFEGLYTKLEAYTKLKDAMVWGNLYGGGAVYMVIKGDDPGKRLDLSKISPDKPLTAVVAFDRHDVTTVVNEDPTAPNYLRPESYTFPTKDPIHWTRVLGPFDGYKMPNRMQKENMGWGGSEVERVSSVVLQSLSVNASVASLVHRADSMMMGVKGLLQKTQNQAKTQELARRWEIAASLMSNNSFLLYDLDQEEPGQMKAELSAPGGLISEMMSLVCAAVGAPVSRFFGTAPKGLASNGEGERKDHEARVKAKQTSQLNPKIAILDQVVSRSVYGVDAEVTYNWNPLEQASDLDKAQTKGANADADATYIDMGAIRPSMVSAELAAQGEYSNLTPEFIAEMQVAEASNKDEDNGKEEYEEEEDKGDTGGQKDRE